MNSSNNVEQGVSRQHSARILHALGIGGALSRTEIAQRVGITRTTLSELINTLLEQGAIVVTDTDAIQRTGRGRPAELLALDPAAGQFMGLDFGRSRVHVAVADASHKIIASGGQAHESSATWPERMELAFKLIDQLSEQTGAHYGALRCIGIGYPGPLSSAGSGNRATEKDSLCGTTSDVISETFTARFNAPVIIDNNSRLAALAEAVWGRANHTEHLLYLRLSTGVGGGLVVGGRLIAGAFGYAAELGHTTVEPDGVTCHCGKRGCLETVASVPAILSRCRLSGVEIQTIDELRAAVRRADPIVNDVLRESASAVGRVLGAAAVALNPAEIVLAGEVIGFAPIMLEQATNIINYELLSMRPAAMVIRGSRLGDDAGALGALVAVFRRSPLLVEYPKPAAPESPPISTN